MLIFLASWAQPASALTMRGRPITGTIQKVDGVTREITLLRDKEGTVIRFIWSKRTIFVASGKMTDAVILKKGAHVVVSHHVPFFGKPFVTRVTLARALSAKTE